MHSSSEPTRRAFLASVPALAAAAAGACVAREYRASDFTRPSHSPVALLAASGYDSALSDVVYRGLAEFHLDVRHKRVLLKPNLVEFEEDTVINTNPFFVAACADAFLRAGASEVVVGEGPGHRRDLEYLAEATGLRASLTDMRVRLTDLNHDDVRPVALGSRFMGLQRLLLPVSVLEADVVVSLPKLKIHHWAGVTCAMKNLFGMVPGAVYGWPKNLLHHRGIHHAIVDLAATIRPDFAIVDAIVGMEGDGPIMGRARQAGFIAMGPDLVALDATCARTIGLNPDRIDYLARAGRFLGHAGSDRIVHRGETPRRFETRFDLIDRLKHLQLGA